MILDIITAALIVIPMAIGMAKGVVYVAVRALGWVGALVISFLLNPLVRGHVAKSRIGDAVYAELEARIGGSVENVDAATESLPQIIGGGIHDAARDTADMLIQSLGGLIISIITFVIMVLLLRIIMFIVMRATKKRDGKPIPVLTRMNKFAGLLVGGVEGLLLAFLFLAALIPIINMGSPETVASIVDGLRYSYLAGPLYDGNLLMVVVSFD